MINAVIFDMDGVLIDTEKYLVRFWVQAGREAGFDVRPEHGLLIRSLAGQYAGPLLKKIFGENFDYPAVRARRKELMARHIAENGLEKKPFVDETLDALRSMGIKTAVATATDRERARKYLTQIGVLDKFNKIICADMVENGKPQPDIYLYACSQIGEVPKNCMAVEDSPNGVRSAALAGLVTVMIPDLTPPDDELKALIQAKGESLKDIPEIVKRINGRDMDFQI